MSAAEPVATPMSDEQLFNELSSELNRGHVLLGVLMTAASQNGTPLDHAGVYEVCDLVGGILSESLDRLQRWQDEVQGPRDLTELRKAQHAAHGGVP